VLDSDPNGLLQHYRTESYSYFLRALIGRDNQLMVVGPCGTAHIKNEEAGGMSDEVHHDLTLSPTFLHYSIIEAQQRWEDPTPSSFMPSPRCQNLTLSQRPFVDFYHFIDKYLYPGSIVISSSSNMPNGEMQ
jgi:hypothetical protein